MYIHPHYINLVTIKVAGYWWKAVNRLSSKWWRVKIGRNCSFRGKTIWRLLPSSSITIGDNCSFNSNHRSNLIGLYSPCMVSTIARGAKIEIGNNCGFSGTVIGAALSIRIGNNVRCGANSLITDSDWHGDDQRTSPNAEVIIEDNVWLGYGVKVLKGVTIGKNSLVGAGSIVTKSIPANCVAAGNPCKVIKTI